MRDLRQRDAAHGQAGRWVAAALVLVLAGCGHRAPADGAGASGPAARNAAGATIAQTRAADTGPVNAVAGAQLAGLLPARIGTLRRTSLDSTCCGLPGMSTSHAVARYAGPGGTLTLTLTDMGDERGMLGMLDVLQSTTSADGSFVRMRRQADGVRVEKHQPASAARPEQDVCEQVVAHRFVIQAQGDSMPPLCRAVAAVPASALPPLARAAGVPTAH
jgi:hypothetical protein